MTEWESLIYLMGVQKEYRENGKENICKEKWQGVFYKL